MAAATERITKTPGVCGGRACIAGHRVRVLDLVIWHEQQGLSPDEIVSQIPSITLPTFTRVSLTITIIAMKSRKKSTQSARRLTSSV
jgi:uncharacterized protein (DUF433 family)